MTDTRADRVNPEALRATRKAQKLSQAALGEQSGLTEGYISFLETGRRRQVRKVSLRALAAALNVNPDDLVIADQPVGQQ
jgi:transcriptional regulator with XRE-family HTH domain